jgi:hypothetical protein
MKRYQLEVGLLVVSGLAFAQAVSYKLSINGKSYSSNAIVVRNETYVPLKALQAAGVRSSLKGGVLTLTLSGGGTTTTAQKTEGGANQIAALDGCIGEWMFNGIWRVRVTNPTPISGDRNGMTYRFEFRNGTNKGGFAPAGTGFKGIMLALDDGTTVGAAYVNDIIDPPYIPGGSHAQVVEFFWENTERTPTKLIVQFDPNDAYYKLSEVKFSVPNPSLRINTKCQK